MCVCCGGGWGSGWKSCLIVHVVIITIIVNTIIIIIVVNIFIVIISPVFSVVIYLDDVWYDHQYTNGNI